MKEIIKNGNKMNYKNNREHKRTGNKTNTILDNSMKGMDSFLDRLF